MANRETLGSRVRRLRELRPGSPTQVEMAVEIGIGRSTLAGIEAGIAAPGRQTLVAIADYLGVGVDDLLAGDDIGISENEPPSPRKRKLAERKREAQLLAAWRVIPLEDQAIVMDVVEGFAQKVRAAAKTKAA